MRRHRHRDLELFPSLYRRCLTADCHVVGESRAPSSTPLASPSRVLDRAPLVDLGRTSLPRRHCKSCHSVASSLATAVVVVGGNRSHHRLRRTLFSSLRTSFSSTAPRCRWGPSVPKHRYRGVAVVGCHLNSTLTSSPSCRPVSIAWKPTWSKPSPAQSLSRVDLVHGGSCHRQVDPTWQPLFPRPGAPCVMSPSSVDLICRPWATC